jgi:hypothetical protein
MNDPYINTQANHTTFNTFLQSNQLNPQPNPTHTILQVERATVILREMPSDTPEAKLRSFFDALPGCPPIKGLRADVNDMWCVHILMRSFAYHCSGSLTQTYPKTNNKTGS